MLTCIRPRIGEKTREIFFLESSEVTLDRGSCPLGGTCINTTASKLESLLLPKFSRVFSKQQVESFQSMSKSKENQVPPFFRSSSAFYYSGLYHRWFFRICCVPKFSSISAPTTSIIFSPPATSLSTSSVRYRMLCPVHWHLLVLSANVFL